MAELVTGVAGPAQSFASGLLSQGQGVVDRYFPPERRAELWALFQKFMTEKPMLASFLLSQIAISGIPLGLFVLMTITVAVFALVAALLLGLLGALLFIALCVGIALIFVLPTLFFTTMVATFLWLWGVGTYYIVKWFNQKEIPGIHKPLSTVLDSSGKNAQLGALNPDPNAAKATGRQGHDDEDGAANGSAGDNELLSKVKQASGVDVGSVGDVKKKLDINNVGQLRKKAQSGTVEDVRKELGVHESGPTGKRSSPGGASKNSATGGAG